jgi:hypothetical protein
MFDRYTDRARRVVALAGQEAGLMMHDTVDTGHLLLGLLREGEAVAFQALDALAVTLETAREAVGKRRACGDTHPTAARPFTPRLKKALELALREALQLGCTYVATEHLLLGLIKEGSDTGALALADCGKAEGDRGFSSQVRAKVLELLHGYAEDGRGGRPAVPAAGWTADESGRTNASAVYKRLCREVDALLREGGGHCLDPGWTAGKARLIMSQLAHVHGLAPALPESAGSTEVGENPAELAGRGGLPLRPRPPCPSTAPPSLQAGRHPGKRFRGGWDAPGRDRTQQGALAVES